jgi:hypothetical protein
MSKVIVDEQKAEIVLEAGIDKSKVKGLYYVGEDGNVWVNRMGGTSKKVYETGILLEKDYRYFVNQQGDVGRYQNKEYTCSECKELKSGAFDSTICKSCYDELEELKIINEGLPSIPSFIKFVGLYAYYAEEILSKEELKQLINESQKNDVSLSEYILDGFGDCEYGVDRDYDDCSFVIGYAYQLFVEDQYKRELSSHQEDKIKLTKSDQTDNGKLFDCYKINVTETYKGDFCRYKLEYVKNKKFNPSLLSITVEKDEYLTDVFYNSVQLEDFEDIRDGRGKGSWIELSYYDKNGNEKELDPDSEL